MLLKCAELKDFSEWNDYIENLDGKIQLSGANFDGINFTDVNFTRKSGIGVNLSEASFRNSKLIRVDFSKCNLISANFNDSEIFNSFFNEASFSRGQLKNSKLTLVNFYKATLNEANIKNSEFFNSNFYETLFYDVNLEGARFIGGGNNPLVIGELRMNLCGAIFRNAKFNNDTYFDLFYVSRNIDFRTTSFEAANYSIELRQTLQYCNRRHNWEDWYGKQGKIIAFFAKAFWKHSDYGHSAKQIIKCFFSVNLFFSLIYFAFPSLIDGLNSHDLIRSIYFSFVTMTTLGFGDMHAANSSIAQCIIIIQVLYGYFLLGGLITVFSILFASDGPPEGLINNPNTSNIKVSYWPCIRQAMKSAKGPGNFRNLCMYSPKGKKDGIQIIPLSEVAVKDEFLNIKNVSHDDIMAAHRVPPQMMGIMTNNVGGLEMSIKPAKFL